MRHGNKLASFFFFILFHSCAFADTSTNSNYGPYGNGAEDLVGGLIAGEMAASAANNSNGSSGGSNNYYYSQTADNTAAAYPKNNTAAHAAAADRYTHPVDTDVHQAVRRATPNRGVTRGEIRRR